MVISGRHFRSTAPMDLRFVRTVLPVADKMQLGGFMVWINIHLHISVMLIQILNGARSWFGLRHRFLGRSF